MQLGFGRGRFQGFNLGLLLLNDLTEHGRKLGVVHGLVAFLVGAYQLGKYLFQLLGQQAHLRRAGFAAVLHTQRVLLVALAVEQAPGKVADGLRVVYSVGAAHVAAAFT